MFSYSSPFFIYQSELEKVSSEEKESRAQPTMLAAPSIKWARDEGELHH